MAKYRVFLPEVLDSYWDSDADTPEAAKAEAILHWLNEAREMLEDKDFAFQEENKRTA